MRRSPRLARESARGPSRPSGCRSSAAASGGTRMPHVITVRGPPPDWQRVRYGVVASKANGRAFGAPARSPRRLPRVISGSQEHGTSRRLVCQRLGGSRLCTALAASPI
jgi:hypothetical protein